MCYETECIITLQSHSKKSLLAPTENVYQTSYWSSIVYLVLSSLFQRYSAFVR